MTVEPTLAVVYTDVGRVWGEVDRQYVVTSAVPVGEHPPARGGFALETDTKSVEPMDPLNPHVLLDSGTSYRGAPGWIGFSVPKPLNVERATITWPGGARDLSDAAIERLARPPTAFEVHEVSTPASAAPGDDVLLSVTVENVGDVAGRWVGALTRAGPEVVHVAEAAIRMDVPADETRTWEYQKRVPDDLGDRAAAEMTFTLDHRDGRLSRTVAVESESETSDVRT